MIHKHKFIRYSCVPLLILLVLSCGSPSPRSDSDDDIRGVSDVGRYNNRNEIGSSVKTPSKKLSVDPSSVQEHTREFIRRIQRTGTRPGDKREVYEAYIYVIGANGILDSIERIWPKGHSQAHDLGKVLYAQLNDMGESLRVCSDRMYSGCMHGVLMEAFASATSGSSQPINMESLKGAIAHLCYTNKQMIKSHSPGDCAHGVGHALMFLTEYDVPDAIHACKELEDTAMAYYCATGAYMEYVAEHDRVDAQTKSLFYPCDSSDYPAACARYKMYRVAERYEQSNKGPEVMRKDCEQLQGTYRLGCFHGLGNAYLWAVLDGTYSLKAICVHGTEEEQYMCIEGVMERMSKYAHTTAGQFCDDLEARNRATCLQAVEQGMYDMDKDFTLYVQE